MSMPWVRRLVDGWARRRRGPAGEQRPARRRRLLLENLEDRTVPSTVSWIGAPGAPGNFNDASKWLDQTTLTNHVPTAADEAVIGVAGVTVTHATGSDTVHSLTIGDNLNDTFVLSGGTLTLSTDSVSGSTDAFNLSGGTLTGTGNLTINGSLSWTAGTMSGAGTTALAAGAGGTLSGAGYKNLGRTLANAGTLDYTGSGFNFGSGTGWDVGVLDNTGVFNASGGGFGYFNAVPHAFNNAGTFNYAGPGSFTSGAVAFNNTGTVNVAAGTLSLAGGGTDTGAFALDAGAALNFSNGTHNLDAGSISGAGAVAVSGGTVNLNAGFSYVATGAVTLSSGTLTVDGNVSVQNFTPSGGTLTGPGFLTVAGTLTWTGGSMAGTGVTDVAPGGFLNINGGNSYTGLRTINNEGTNISANRGNVFVSTDNTFTDLDSFLASGLQSLADDLGLAYANPIPLLGHALGATPGSLVNELAPGLANALQGVSLAAIQQGLFGVFGPQGLNILNGSTPQSIAISTTGGRAAITLPLQVTFTAQVPFDIGLPGLPLQLSASGTVQDSVTVTANLTFSAAQLAGQSPTLAINPSTLRAQLSAAAPGLVASAGLGLFQAQAADDPSNPSSVNLTYASNFSTNTSGSLVVSTTTNGSATVNLLLSGSFSGDPVNDPTVTAAFHLGWAFTNADPARSGLFGNTPSIAFNNVQLHLGSFVGDFLGSAVSDVQQLTEPLAPLADFLSTPLPVLSDLAAAAGRGPIYPADLLGSQGQAITRFALAVHVINGLDPTILPDGVIDLGSFTVTDPRAFDGGGDAAPADILQNHAANNVVAQIRALSPGAASFFDQLSMLGSSEGLHFTILDNPTNAFDLLLGRNTTLFTYSLPPLSLSQDVERDVPTPVPFVVVHFGGNLDVSVSATFGCDASGLLVLQR
jgi:adhesin HecA-like repeat protein